MSNFIQQIPHMPKPPISIEREPGDVIVIEGVRYDADYFRTFGAPDADVLYAVQRLEEDCVKLTVIASIEDASEFFKQLEKNA